MKAEFDKEIDALLRRSARAAGGDARASGVTEEAAHLDADELSAFAEGALPAAARLAAASHLADCGECRGLVVDLSRAAGGGAAVEERAGVAAGVPAINERVADGRGGWLAAFFSPRMLRFVAPALALCLVGAVAFVILRTRRDADSVAQHTARPQDAHTGVVGGIGAGDSAAGSTNASVETNTATSANMAANTNTAPALSDRAAPAEQERQETSAATHEHAAPDGSGARKQEPEAASPEAAPVSKPDAPVDAPAPVAATAAAPPPPSPARDARERKGESRRGNEDEVARADESQAQERRVNQSGNFELQQQAPDGSRNRAGNMASGGGRAAPRSQSRSVQEPPVRSEQNEAARVGRSRPEARERAKSADDGPAVETRAAAGRRFRREGNAWVDVNYRPSMSMTGVRRGTESFRALVADIPELGRIAEQLPGEVIAVVRGRAYRIR